MLDVNQYQSTADSWGIYGQTLQGPTVGGYSEKETPTVSADKTTAGVGNSVGSLVQSMPTFGSDFVVGMKLGYMGEQLTVAPFLAYRKAKQEKNILGLQQEILEMQAQTYQTAAEDVIRAGHQSSAAVSYQSGQAKSSARASMGASGVRVNAAGSSARVLASYDLVKEVQTNQIMANAVNQSFGYKRAAVNARNQALAVESAKKSISPWASAITTFISSSVDSLNTIGSLFGGGQGGALNGQTWSNLGQFFANGLGGK